MKTRHVDCPRSATFVLRFAILKLAISLQASYAVAYVAAVRLPTRSRSRLRASPARPLADICVRPRYGLSSSSSLFFLSAAPASLSTARPTAIRCENYSTISPPRATTPATCHVAPRNSHFPNTGISVRPIFRCLENRQSTCFRCSRFAVRDKPKHLCVLCALCALCAEPTDSASAGVAADKHRHLQHRVRPCRMR